MVVSHPHFAKKKKKKEVSVATFFFELNGFKKKAKVNFVTAKGEEVF